MLDLRKALNTYLKTIHPRTYHQAAPEHAVFPYLVYSFQIIDDGESREMAVIDVDGWDINSDLTELETLMTLVNTGLNKTTLASGNLTATCYLDTKVSMTDDVPEIRRRKYIYQAKLFRRG